jgi:hypothetical protein
MGLLAGYGALTLIKQSRVDIQTVPAPKQIASADRDREPSQLPGTIEQQALDTPVDNALIAPVAIDRQQKRQPLLCRKPTLSVVC